MNKEKLRRRVKELEREVESLTLDVGQLRAMVLLWGLPAASTSIPPINIPSHWTPSRCLDGEHNFPSPWLGIVPPSCTKCGWSSGEFSTITGVESKLIKDCSDYTVTASANWPTFDTITTLSSDENKK